MKTNNNNGFVLIHRSILSWEWWDDLPTRNLFFYCLLSANHKDESWHGIEIPRGGLLTSYDALAKGTGFSVKQMRRAVKNLKKTEEIVVKRAGNGALLTINNYDRYQDMTNNLGQTKGRLGADLGQTKGRLGATNKEDKEYKEEKEINNNIYNPLVFPPSLDDIAAFCRMRNNYIVPERFLKWYTDNGWTDNKKKPISDWRNAIYNWEKRDRADGKIPPPPGVRLGLGEFMKTDGTRSYGDGRVSVPLDAPPRPSPSYFWLASSNCWMID